MFGRLLFLQEIFSHPLRLILIYLALILLSLGWFGAKYWQLIRLNSATIPFTQTTGNTVVFTFIPKNDGNYSVDLSFLNKKVNQENETCGFSWKKSNENECKKALIFRTMSGTINNEYFSRRAQYQTWKPGDLEYGFYNHSIAGASLNISKFHGKANTPIPMRIKIDANASEIRATNPVIIIGPGLEGFMSLGRIFTSFAIIAIPFLFSIIVIFFLRLLKIIKKIQR